MSSDREAMSEQSSLVHEGASYDEVYPLGHEPMAEDLTWSPKREPFTHFLAEEEKEEEEKDEDECEQEDDDEEGKDHGEGDKAVGEEEDDVHRPFILLLIWTINDFYPTMSLKVFNNLLTRFQIPDHILVWLLRKFEKCYSGKIVDVSLYDAVFTAGLRILLIELHHQLANYLGLSVNQLTPNVWRIFIKAEVIWGQLSGGNHCLTLKEFFYYYKPQ